MLIDQLYQSQKMNFMVQYLNAIKQDGSKEKHFQKFNLDLRQLKRSKSSTMIEKFDEY